MFRLKYSIDLIEGIYVRFINIINYTNKTIFLIYI
jgi:hypothetical protein